MWIGFSSLPIRQGPPPSFSSHGLVTLTFSGSRNAVPSSNRMFSVSRQPGTSKHSFPAISILA